MLRTSIFAAMLLSAFSSPALADDDPVLFKKTDIYSVDRYETSCIATSNPYRDGTTLHFVGSPRGFLLVVANPAVSKKHTRSVMVNVRMGSGTSVNIDQMLEGELDDGLLYLPVDDSGMVSLALETWMRIDYANTPVFDGLLNGTEDAIGLLYLCVDELPVADPFAVEDPFGDPT